MPNSKPVSESGCGSKDYDRAQATLRLMKELSVGQKSGEESGWFLSPASSATFIYTKSVITESYLSSPASASAPCMTSTRVNGNSKMTLEFVTPLLR